MSSGMHRLRWAAAFLVSCELIVSIARAAPPVIYDSGQTQPLAPYVRQAFGQSTGSDTSAPAHHVRPPAIDPRTFGLPVHTPQLTPGPVTPRALHHAPPRPLCLLGAGERSRRWLIRFHRQLRAAGALCLLVNVDTPAEVQTMKRLAAGIALLPASGTAIARQLELKHYPVLISRQSGIEQ